MREVIPIAAAEGKRLTEEELFAGTMIRLGKAHGIVTPVNDFLYRHIQAIDQGY